VAGAVRELIAEGKVKHFGMSKAAIQTISPGTRGPAGHRGVNDGRNSRLLIENVSYPLSQRSFNKVVADTSGNQGDSNVYRKEGSQRRLLNKKDLLPNVETVRKNANPPKDLPLQDGSDNAPLAR